MRGNAVLRHLAGRVRFRPDLSEAGRGAEREHAAEPNAHGIFQCCRSHDCTSLLLSTATRAAPDLLLGDALPDGSRARGGTAVPGRRGACGLNESRAAMTAPRIRSGNSSLPLGRCLFQHRRLLRLVGEVPARDQFGMPIMQSLKRCTWRWPMWPRPSPSRSSLPTNS